MINDFFQKKQFSSFDSFFIFSKNVSKRHMTYQYVISTLAPLDREIMGSNLASTTEKRTKKGRIRRRVIQEISKGRRTDVTGTSQDINLSL